MPIDYQRQSEFLKALAHPLRLRIVEGLLRKKECNVNKMVLSLGVPQSTVSQHLALLKAKGIVALRRQGVRVCYRIADKKAEALLELIRSDKKG
jgi:DNA-binding transcriptional ArsR family regulator